MNLRKTVTSIFATSAILLGMTAGIATAQTIDEADGKAQLEVTCAPTTNIELVVGGPFTINSTDGDVGVASQGGFEIELDLRCNWSTEFEVNATIDNFVHEDYLDHVLTDQNWWFDGGRLTLTRDNVKYEGVNGITGVGFNPLLETAGPPKVNPTVFAGTTSYTGDAIEDHSVQGRFITLVAAASPGVTTVSYTGELDTGGLQLVEGTYKADLTLELIVH